MLEKYLNSRLRSIAEKLDLAKSDMVLCHLDVAPRNVVLTGQKLWLLNWEAAGFYPRGFEYCALRVNRGRNGEDSLFAEMLEKCLVALERPSPRDIAEGSLM
ncbi:hypothetical protein EJ03DRAFT_339118 [Teratosphaeria nubilosa]|uniref:non-specific serine/threonine protein kinase n=1 Tax=Teratosphaeria nubilosa TaxID=161662 RepID=A0A6G1KXP4_9PEZI|nr:hypothetical protein EJ03DRAFT_339118 [Teratosphaeria nubilosa]